MPLPITALFDLGQATIDALEAGWPGEAEPLPDRQYVSNGMVVWDCESLVVFVENTIGTEADVAQEAFIEMGLGFAMRAAIIGVTILRCVPTIVEDGQSITLPDPMEVQAASKVIYTDATVMFNVLAAAQQAGALATCNGLAFERWSSLPEQGGLAGGTLRFRALLL